MPVAHLSNADFAIVTFGLIAVALMILIDAGSSKSHKDFSPLPHAPSDPIKARGGPIIDLLIIAGLAAVAYVLIFLKWTL